jgi:hypothetical protein
MLKLPSSTTLNLAYNATIQNGSYCKFLLIVYQGVGTCYMRTATHNMIDIEEREKEREERASFWT